MLHATEVSERRVRRRAERAAAPDHARIASAAAAQHRQQLRLSARQSGDIARAATRKQQTRKLAYDAGGFVQRSGLRSVGPSLSYRVHVCASGVAV